jgi:hypothetical protein
MLKNSAKFALAFLPPNGKCRNERETPLVFRGDMVNMKGVKSKPSSTRKSKPKQQGNYIDTFVKRMFGQVLVFTDFLLNVRLMYSRQDQWREDALLIMFE